MKKLLTGFCILLLLAGCSAMDAILGNPEDFTLTEFKATGPAYPPYEGTVQVLEKAPAEYTTLGTLWVRDDFYEWDELIEDMKERAAKQGANAIIITQKREEKKEEGDKAEVGNIQVSSYRMYYEKYLEGLAIRLPE